MALSHSAVRETIASSLAIKNPGGRKIFDSDYVKNLWKTCIKKMAYNTELAQEGLTMQVLSGLELSDHDLISIVQNYREDFGYRLGDAWGEYVQCTHSNCSSVFSIQDAYGLGKGEYIPLRTLEEQREIQVECSDHPGQENLQEIWNKTALFYSFHKKYRTAGADTTQLSLLRDKESNIVGYNVVYPSNYDTAWDSEFKNMYPGLKETYAKQLRNIVGNDFSDSSPVYVWNLLGITKPYRKPHITKQLLSSVAEHLPEEYDTYPVVLELDKLNPYTSIIMAVGGDMLCDHPSQKRLGLAIGSSKSIKKGVEQMLQFYEGDPEMVKKVTEARKRLLSSLQTSV